MTDIFELKGEDVFTVELVRENQPYREDSKLKGEHYNLYTVNGKGFTLNTSHPFCKDFASGKVQKIKFREDGEYIRFAGYITDSQVIRQKSFERAVKVLEAREMTLEEALAFT